MVLRSRSGEAAGAPFWISAECGLHDLQERKRSRRDGEEWFPERRARLDRALPPGDAPVLQGELRSHKRRIRRASFSAF